MADERLTDLEDLLASKGWQLLIDHADQEWGKVGFAEKVARTIGGTNLDEKLALAQLQQATVTQREVWRLMEWPKDQAQKIRRELQQAQLVTSSRRGPGL